MIRMATMLAILIMGLIAGPAVSLYGWATGSPVGGGGAGAVADLQRSPGRAAGDGGAAPPRALAAVGAVLDELLRVVPRAATGGHRDREEEPGDDRSDQQPAEHAHVDDPDDD